MLGGYGRRDGADPMFEEHPKAGGAVQDEGGDGGDVLAGDQAGHRHRRKSGLFGGPREAAQGLGIYPGRARLIRLGELCGLRNQRNVHDSLLPSTARSSPLPG